MPGTIIGVFSLLTMLVHNVTFVIFAYSGFAIPSAPQPYPDPVAEPDQPELKVQY